MSQQARPQNRASNARPGRATPKVGRPRDPLAEHASIQATWNHPDGPRAAVLAVLEWQHALDDMLDSEPHMTKSGVIKALAELCEHDIMRFWPAPVQRSVAELTTDPPEVVLVLSSVEPEPGETWTTVVCPSQALQTVDPRSRRELSGQLSFA